MSLRPETRSVDPAALGLTTEADEQQRLNSFQIQLDENGRVPSGLKRFETRVSEGCISSDMIAAACRECEQLCESDVDFDASFWMPAEATACSALEALAKTIFRAHSAGVSFDSSTRWGYGWCECMFVDC